MALRLTPSPSLVLLGLLIHGCVVVDPDATSGSESDTGGGGPVTQGHSQTSVATMVDPTTASASTSDNTTATAGGVDPSSTSSTSATDATSSPDATSGPVESTGPAADASSGETAATTGPTGEPGFYGPCLPDMTCPLGQTCTVVEGIAGDFCTPKCLDDSQCPPANEGTAPPMCVVTEGGSMEPTLCAMICDVQLGDGQCPADTSCEPVPDSFPFGVCTSG